MAIRLISAITPMLRSAISHTSGILPMEPRYTDASTAMRKTIKVGLWLLMNWILNSA